MTDREFLKALKRFHLSNDVIARRLGEELPKVRQWKLGYSAPDASLRAETINRLKQTLGRM